MTKDLIARVEAATADEQREVLEAAFKAMSGQAPPSEYDGRAWTRGEPEFSPAWTAWIAKQCRFLNLLEARAFLDAAMMLVPEGPYLSNVKELWNGPGTENGKSAMAIIARYGKTMWTGDFTGLAATPALALACAALRARGEA